jgi:hypothetical protein
MRQHSGNGELLLGIRRITNLLLIRAAKCFDSRDEKTENEVTLRTKGPACGEKF